MAPFLNEYEILSCTTSQEGGEATIYKVRHIQLGYIRALRVLHGYIQNETDPRYCKFLEECKLLLRIGNGGHHNIIRIFRPSLVNNQAFVEMEFIVGTDMQDYLKKCNGFIPYEEFIKFVYQISDALAYCHHDIYAYCYDKNEDNIQDNDDGTPKITQDIETKLIEKYQVIHNDIHSKNVMRRNNGEYVLLDFGLAVSDKNNVRSSIRKAGVLEYMAPEKFEDGGILTTQSDIYAFGILMYEMLCGEVPFKLEGNSPSQEYKVQLAHETQSIPSIYEKRKTAFINKYPEQEYEQDYPDWIEQVILKCLEKKKENRYADGKALFNDIKKRLGENTETKSDKKSEAKETKPEENKTKKPKGTKHLLLIIFSILTFIALCAVLVINVPKWISKEDYIPEVKWNTQDTIPYEEESAIVDNESSQINQAQESSQISQPQLEAQSRQKKTPTKVSDNKRPADTKTSKPSMDNPGIAGEESAGGSNNQSSSTLTSNGNSNNPKKTNGTTSGFEKSSEQQKKSMEETYKSKQKSMEDAFEQQKQKMEDQFRNHIEQ